MKSPTATLALTPKFQCTNPASGPHDMYLGNLEVFGLKSYNS
jgi:hypothetical protein